MTKNVLHLFANDYRYHWKTRKMQKTLGLFLGFYLLFLLPNMDFYKEINTIAEVQRIDGLLLQVPIAPPRLDFNYIESFIPISMEKSPLTEVGNIIYPDRLDESTAVAPMGGVFFFGTALMVILFAYREFTTPEEKAILTTLLQCPVQKKDVLEAKLLIGIALLSHVFLIDSCAIGLLAWAKNLGLTWTQIKQLALFNLLHCTVLMILYILTLGLSFRLERSTEQQVEQKSARKKDVLLRDSARTLLASVLMLIVVVLIIPNVIQTVRDFIYDNFAWNHPTEWYWNSRYLGVADLYSAFGELTSDLLFMERARMIYRCIPWTAQLANSPNYSIDELLRINWLNILTLLIWLIAATLFTQRRLEKADVV